MHTIRSKNWLALGLTLAVFIVIARVGVLAHVDDHDPELLHHSVCLICLGASSLASACLDNGVPTAIQPSGSCQLPNPVVIVIDRDEPRARQRSPPSQFI